jgi:hypothetical protein
MYTSGLGCDEDLALPSGSRRLKQILVDFDLMQKIFEERCKDNDMVMYEM